jgi:hypothetical protein
MIFSQVTLDSPALDFGATSKASKSITKARARQVDVSRRWRA